MLKDHVTALNVVSNVQKLSQGAAAIAEGGGGVSGGDVAEAEALWSCNPKP